MDEAYRASKFRAWMIGGLIGVIGGVIAGGLGAASGLCCLLQFVNILVPLAVGLIAGAISAGAADWSNLPGEGATGIGAMLGLRGGGLAAILCGVVAFLCTLLFPLGVALLSASGGADIGEMIKNFLISMVGATIWAAVMAGTGTIIGLLLAVGSGAIIGTMLGRK